MRQSGNERTRRWGPEKSARSQYAACQGKVVAVHDDAFAAEVLKSEAPVVVDFWATWCMPCQVMGGLMSELTKECAGRIRVMKMNVEENRETAQRLSIRSIPTVLFFKEGRPVDQVVGLMPKNDLAEKFERLLSANEDTGPSAVSSGESA
jgi:thioredoxin 1